MNMDTLRFCPQCQQPLPNHAPEGLCPQCLMKAAAAPPSEPQMVTTSGGGIVDIGDPVAVGKCLPQFEIIELLGRGGMGVVYKARQINLDRVVALKILPPSEAQTADFVARFTREARSLAKLSHPNIVTVHDFGESGGLYYFIMEYVDGANLRQMMQAKQLTAPQALAIVPKICDALQFAHEEGVMHRDIKPENILLDKNGRVKIADFGLAKLLRREPTDHTLTMSGMTLGTPRYMAPEQLDKPESVDHRADIYSLGVVFYEMLTGELPMGRFAPPSQKVQVDVRLDEIVLHALERDVERRYQHVSEIRTDVENVTATPTAAPSPGSESPKMPASQQGMPPPSFVISEKWRPHEILCVVLLALAFVCGATNAILEIGNGHPVANPFAVPVIIAAAIGALGLLIQYQFARPAGARAMLPEFSLVVLGAVAGGLPWTWWFRDVPGWDFWEGAVFAALNFIVALFIFTMSGAKWARSRAIAVLFAGLAGFALVLLFTNLPVQIIGSRGLFGNGPDVINQKPGRAGIFISAVLSLLTVVAGILELRRILNSPNAQATNDSNHCTKADADEPRLNRCALWGAIWLSLGIPAAVVLGLAIYDARGGQLGGILHLPVGLWVAAAMSAPFGATLLGGIAIAQIKRSGGKLYGLRLAAADALFFPLLVVGALAFWLTNLVAFTIAFNLHKPVPSLPGAPPERGLAVIDFAVLHSLVALTVMFFAGRAAWRRIAGNPAAETKSPANDIKPGVEKPKSRRFLGLPAWLWPVSAALLIVAAVFIPRPGDLPEPRAAEEALRPMLLLTPEGGSYRFVGYLDSEWKKFKPVYAVNRKVIATQSVTRTFGWDSQRGVSLGFFQREGNWRYGLIAPRFDWKVGEPGPMEIPDAEVQTLRPMITAELERLHPGQGARLNQVLDHGENVSTFVCWQNAVVLLAWLSLPLALIALGRLILRALFAKKKDRTNP